MEEVANFAGGATTCPLAASSIIGINLYHQRITILEGNLAIYASERAPTTPIKEHPNSCS